MPFKPLESSSNPPINGLSFSLVPLCAHDILTFLSFEFHDTHAFRIKTEIVPTSSYSDDNDDDIVELMSDEEP